MSPLERQIRDLNAMLAEGNFVGARAIAIEIAADLEAGREIDSANYRAVTLALGLGTLALVRQRFTDRHGVRSEVEFAVESMKRARLPRDSTTFIGLQAFLTELSRPGPADFPETLFKNLQAEARNDADDQIIIEDESELAPSEHDARSDADGTRHTTRPLARSSDSHRAAGTITEFIRVDEHGQRVHSLGSSMADVRAGRPDSEKVKETRRVAAQGAASNGRETDARPTAIHQTPPSGRPGAIPPGFTTGYVTGYYEPKQSPGLGAVILRSLLRPKAVIAALAVMALSVTVGLLTRSTEYAFTVSLLRPASGGATAKHGERLVNVLSKESLRGLPTRPDILRGLESHLKERFTDAEPMDRRTLHANIGATVDVGDFNSTSFVLNVTFTASTEEIAEAGALWLKDAVSNRHDMQASERLDRALAAYERSETETRAELARIEAILAQRSNVADGSMVGDYDTRLTTLINMYVYARQNLEQARIELAAGGRATEVYDSALITEPERVTITTTSSDTAPFYLTLQPVYGRLFDLQRDRFRLEKEAAAKGIGEGHPLKKDLAALNQEIVALEADITRRLQEADVKIRNHHVENPNSVHDRLKVFAVSEKASREAREKSVEHWQEFHDKLINQLNVLTEGGGEIAKLTQDKKILGSLLGERSETLSNLRLFREGEFPGMTLLSESDQAAAVSGGLFPIVLLALFLGFFAAASVTIADGVKTSRAKGGMTRTLKKSDVQG